MSFAQFQDEDRRLVLLRGLAAAVQYRANAHLLRAYCDAAGHTISLAKLGADLAWLADCALVTVDASQPGVTVATLTAQGLDVSEGRAIVPGVRRPVPGA